ncbi:hypothetical protein K470DRAFT_257042 [Piedraia hortae CBS 480.64]|uniref:Fe2OG dioxygenase domain-containing protein n=1 Tax=Piedraia hortae CBS 480.64 TaxID=1314780 RepID=A0A6A7C356_9PEZI|nr:hypothetical protein K470DRAFT_257042 [Piedraia hortae CBS 480.64]
MTTSKPIFPDSSSSSITNNLLSPSEASTIFTRLKSEAQWQTMHHQTGEVPRLVCCQGDTGSDEPLYRHPSDRTLPLTPWTPAVETIRRAAEQSVGHELNHALIQLYRSGADYISEHSDKTLDIAPGSFIVNVSFGAQRTMKFRSKRGYKSSNSVDTIARGTDMEGSTSADHTVDGPADLLQGGVDPQTSPPTPPSQRTIIRVPLPHNSLLSLSLPHNAKYLHSIPTDKRPASLLSPEEAAYGGERISLTFRRIGTFLTQEGKIWGQGAVSKTRDKAGLVIEGGAEAEGLLKAFGRENQCDEGFDWEGTYGRGWDLVHLKTI